MANIILAFQHLQPTYYASHSFGMPKFGKQLSFRQIHQILIPTNFLLYGIIHTHTHTRVCTCLYIYIHVHVCNFYTHTCVTYTHAHLHTHTCTHTHTHTHTHTFSWCWSVGWSLKWFSEHDVVEEVLSLCEGGERG